MSTSPDRRFRPPATPDACCGCSACAEICPRGCLSLRPDAEGFSYPALVSPEACIACGLCHAVCPMNPDKTDATPTTTPTTATAYAAQNLSLPERMEASSGGIFSLLAADTLSRGGLVAGVVWDDAFRATHTLTDSPEVVALMRGSKYVQSDKLHVFSDVREALRSSRPVFFTGTPCEVAGLRAFLRKPSPLLLTAECVCHGNPSPLVWARYVSAVSAELGEPLRSVRFRRKTDAGWHRFCVAFATQYRERSSVFSTDLYMKTFLSDISLRPSCYTCPFKGGRSGADLSLADFWGIRDVLPTFDDDCGTSFIALHTPLAREVFTRISPSIRAAEVSLADAVRSNPAYHSPVSCRYPRRRRRLFADLAHGVDIFSALRRATHFSRFRRLALRVRRKFSRLFRTTR